MSAIAAATSGHPHIFSFSKALLRTFAGAEPKGVRVLPPLGGPHLDPEETVELPRSQGSDSQITYMYVELHV